LARQLILDLGHRPASGRDDFLVGPSNAAAVEMIDQWPRWPAHAVLLLGPAGAGKSHLATVWQMRSGAHRINLADLTVDSVPAAFSANALALEDAEPDRVPERAMFHLLNLARQQGGHVLVTSRYPAAHWQVKLPDLASRLKAIPEVAIAEPDDALLRGVLVKHFADRQIAVDEPMITYLLTRMPRSMAAARELVGLIDAQALEEGVSVSRTLAGRVLQGYEGPGSAPRSGDMAEFTKTS